MFQTPLAVLALVALWASQLADAAEPSAVGYFVTAAVALALPGPGSRDDVLELLPMWALFEGMIWLAVFVERRHGEKSARSSATLGA